MDEENLKRNWIQQDQAWLERHASEDDAVQAERERIADWLLAQANFLDPRKVSPMVAVIEIYASTIRSGTYAHHTQE